MPNLNHLKQGGAKSTNVFNDDHDGMSDQRRLTFAKVILAQKEMEVAEKSKVARQPLAYILREQDPSRLSISKRLRVVRQSGLSDADYFIHTTALKVVERAMETGVANQLHELFLSMPNGRRRGRLAAWIERFTPFAVAETKAYMPREKREERFFDAAGASRNPFYTLT